MVCRISLRPVGLAAAGLSLVCGCGPAERSPRGGQAPDSPSMPEDSLVLTGRDGVEIWYTISRPATGPDGSRCVERGLEIRRGRDRTQVPLLYTGDAPTLINDSSMRAILWNSCQPVATYLVDLRTGRPVRESEPSPR
jgi:hypothetical protein